MAIIKYDDLTNPPSYNGSPIRSTTDIPEVPSAISEITNDSDFKTNAYHDSNKQNTISDLEDIRDGAEAGADAYQMPLGGIQSTDLNSNLLAKIFSAIQNPSGGSPGNILKYSDSSPIWGDILLGNIYFEKVFQKYQESQPLFTNASPTVSGKSWSDYDIFLVFYSNLAGYSHYDTDYNYSIVPRSDPSSPIRIRLAMQGYDVSRNASTKMWRYISITSSGLTTYSPSSSDYPSSWSVGDWSAVCSIRYVYGIRNSHLLYE